MKKIQVAQEIQVKITINIAKKYKQKINYKKKEILRKKMDLEL